MKPFNKGRLFPHINHKKDDEPKSHPLEPIPSHAPSSNVSIDQFNTLHELLQETQNRNTVLLSQLLEAQLSQTEVMKQMLGMMNKSIKIQTATYRIQKESVKSRLRGEDDEIRSIVNQERNHEEIVLNSARRKVEEKMHMEVELQKSIEIQTQQILISQNLQLPVQQLNQPKPHQDTQPLLKSLQNRVNTPKQLKQTYITIPFGDIDYLKNTPVSDSWPLFQSSLSGYVSSLLESLTSASFHGYSITKQMSKEEASSFFCKNLIHNFITTIDLINNTEKEFWNTKSKAIISLFNKEFKSALGYFKLKFPQKKKGYVSEELKKLIPSFDNSKKFDTFIFEKFKKWLFIEIADRPVESVEGVKYFIDYLIKETKTSHSVFQESMQEIFNIESERRLDHVIGSKLSLNTPQFTEEEKYKQGLEIKTPQIMRIIVKWIECLSEIIHNPDKISDDYFKNEADISNKKPSGISVEEHLIQESLKRKAEFVEFFQTQKAILSKSKIEQEKELLNFQSFLPKVINKYRHLFPLVPSQDLDMGLFVSYAAESLSGITSRNLIKLIQIFEAYPSQKGTPFEVFDLLRAKCSGTMEQIKKVYQKLASSEKFQVIRVKNRLDTGNRDYLVNFIMKGAGLICQLQLNISDQANSQKQQYYDNFNHFLYELERAKYGPLYEAVSIVSNVEDTVSYFSINKLNGLSSKIQKGEFNFTSSPTLIGSEISFEGYSVYKPIFQFVCNKCFEFKRVDETFLKVAEYVGQRSGDNSVPMESQKIVFCGGCLASILKPQYFPRYILSIDCHPCFSYIPSYEKLKELTPTYILIVKGDNQRHTYGYKRFKGNRYFKCMFALCPKGPLKRAARHDEEIDYFNSEAPNLQISLDDKQFFKNSFIFTLQESPQIKIKNLSLKQNSQEMRSMNLFSYFSIQYPQYASQIIHSLNRFNRVKNDLSYTFLATDNYSFLLDIGPASNFQDLVTEHEGNKKIVTLAKQLEKSKEPKWHIVGEYNQKIFSYLEMLYGNCVDFYCEMKKMTALPYLRMTNLKTLKLKLQSSCLIDFKMFWMPELTLMTLELTEAKVTGIGESKIEKLKELHIYADKIDILDFSNARLNYLQKISIIVSFLSNLRGFESKNPTPAQMNKLKQFQCKIVCSLVDLTLLTTTVEVFVFFNDGITKYPSFNNVECLVFYNRIVPFQIIKMFKPFRLFLYGTQNIQNIKNIPSISLMHSLQLHQITLKEIVFNFDSTKLLSLSILNSLCERVDFQHYFSNLISLEIHTTKIEELDISYLSSLTNVEIQGNNLRKLRVKGAEQLRKIDRLNFNYNFYSPSFIQGAEIKDYTGNLWVLPKDQSGYCIDKELGMMIPKLNNEEYNSFLLEMSQNQPSFASFTQDDIILGKVDMSGLQYKYSKWKTFEEILIADKELIKSLQEWGFGQTYSNTWQKRA